MWSTTTYEWVEFTVATADRVRIHWFDSAGVEALESMACSTVANRARTCRAGRSRSRIATARAAGAAPGPWSVRACSAEGCTEVGLFNVP